MNFENILILSFILPIIASIPPLYFTVKMKSTRNLKKMLLPLVLSLTLIFHSLYHLFELIGIAEIWILIMESLSALSLFSFSVLYYLSSEGKI